MEPINESSFVQTVIDGIMTLLSLGGPVVAILLLASIFGLALTFRKFLQFSHVSAPVLQELHDAVDHWQAGEQNRAVEILDGSPLAIAADLRFAMSQHNLNDESLHDEMLRRLGSFLRDYAKDLRLLELIYNLAPVLGLLGTVLGMIDAFRGLAASTGSAGESAALAGGIWEALLTTAVGLSIAITFAIFHALLESRLETLADQVSGAVGRVLSVQAKS